MIQLEGKFPKKLKYLFTVYWKDGGISYQTMDDKSDVVEGKSAFFDICERGIENIARFSLGEVLNPSNEWVVDLTDGHFEHCHKKFELQETLDQLVPREIITKLPFKLIYFRQHQHDSKMTYQLKSSEPVKQEETEHRLRYFFGYEVLVGELNIKRVMSID